MTPLSLRLYKLLSERPGHPFSKLEIRDELSPDSNYKLIDVALCGLRKSLRDFFPADEPCPVTIESHWGLGVALTFLDQPPMPHSGTRWTASRKGELLTRLTSTSLTPEKRSALRQRFPEITDEILERWQTYGLSETGKPIHPFALIPLPGDTKHDRP